jgi:hypothetical protein
LPFLLKGDPVLLPLGTSAPVSGSATISTSGLPTFDFGAQTGLIHRTQAGSGGIAGAEFTDQGAGSWSASNMTAWTPNLTGTLSGATADLTSATAATINEIREAFQIQRLYERDARGGTRYVEILRSHFGITNHPDARLNRPEYLGGGTTPIVVTPVPATAVNTNNNVNIGDLGAYGVAGKGHVGFTKSFVEHGYVFGLVSARADLNYQQGIHRMWSRTTRWDYYWPTLAHLGEQSVLNKEIYSDGSANYDQVFGYQERYAEYRYKPSQISGTLRSDHTTSLDPWHLAQDFAALPVLDNTFIQENPPMDRIKAVSTEPDFILDTFFQYKCARPMPTYSVPGMMGHP